MNCIFLHDLILYMYVYIIRTATELDKVNRQIICLYHSRNVIDDECSLLSMLSVSHM